MKTRYGVGFYPRGRLLAARELLRKVGGKNPAAQPQTSFGYYFVFGNEHDLIAFRAEAYALGFTEENLSFRKEYIYSRSEVLAAPLLNVVVRTAEKGFGGPTYGTQYDLSGACRRCGSGAVQVSPLVLKRSDAPKNSPIYQTLSHEVLLSAELAGALRENTVSGLKLLQAVSHSGGEPLPWYQLVSRTQLPPMSQLTTGIEREGACPVCDRDGHFHTVTQPLEIVYDPRDVNPAHLPDVTHTHERFGNGLLREPLIDSHFATPLLIVKPKIFLIFERMKVRRVKFVPVRIVDRQPTPGEQKAREKAQRGPS